MVKSPAAVAAIGVGGCVLLSLLMREALQAQQQRAATPLEMAIQGRFAGRLVGPVRCASSEVGGKSRTTVRLCVLAGLRKEPIADAAGRAVWDVLGRTAAPPDVVLVEVTDDGTAEVVTRVVPRPSIGR